MTIPQQFPDLPILNLTYLLKIQADANKDPVQACYRYGLPQHVISRIKELPVDRIAALVANLDQSFFCVRTELLDLFDAPPALSGMLASVRADAGSSQTWIRRTPALN
jgi:hypothetical protein